MLRYPVNSMGGEALAEVDVSWHGLAGDRRWSFIRNSAAQSGFPWLTIRELGNMSHYRPSFVEPARPDKSRTVVRTLVTLPQTPAFADDDPRPDRDEGRARWSGECVDKSGAIKRHHVAVE